MLFFKKKQTSQEVKPKDLVISFDKETNTYNVIVLNDNRKVKVIKSKDNELVFKTTYKTCGRPRKED